MSRERSQWSDATSQSSFQRSRLSIVSPLISTQCDHYRALGDLHEALLRAVKEITGKDAAFVRWFGAGSK
ncbi:hypothetical protein EN868_11220 [Mesorhizobium sp. M2D.F.Ca.ET.225.01.1.1]|nr:hypothetical protein EN869_014890 [Mesorhizobium sp. M2D.F.Ca.ET.226.01.1.1]TGP69190.1 hypothetical protein EN868_11220 [Mesorhizobium sp. M2D.F.Ca.ET.225.01.1.1]